MPNDDSMAAAIIRLTSNVGSNSTPNVPEMSTRPVNEDVSFKTEPISKGLRSVRASRDDNGGLIKD